jgi:predicted ATP-dependent endonuclease of OLD family
MIDGDHLEDVRVVYEDAISGTSKVSEDVWPRDKDALFPLQAALGYSIAQSLFYSKRQAIVEGLTDYWIFKAADQILSRRGLSGLRSDLVLVPAGGINKLMPLTSMLLGHDIEIAIILDGDEPGRRKGKELQDNLLSGQQGKCIFVGDYTSLHEAELEDLFPQDFYLKAVQEAYQWETNFTESEEAFRNITKKLKAAFERMGKGEFDKWRPARVILDWIGKDEAIFPAETLNAIRLLFTAVNSAFPTSVSF